MLFTFAKELDSDLARRLDLIKKNFRAASNSVVSNDTTVSPQIQVKLINEIHDKSNNNREDLGRDIDALLMEMALSNSAEDYLKEHYLNVQSYKNIKSYTKEQILSSAVALRGNLDLNVDLDLVIALMDRANEIVTGYELRPAQILSILEFFREKGVNKFCQINTGEGKTTVTSAIAVIKSLQGETVDIITSNAVLAQDAIRARSDFYALFNLSSAHNNADQEYSGGVKDCYANDIVYGTIGNFEFDYLKDHMKFTNTKNGGKFGSLIIDEADNVVLDNALHVAKISGPIAGMEALKYVYINIWQEFISAEQSLGLKDIEVSRITAIDRIAIKLNIDKANIKSKSIIPKFLESYVDRKLDTWIKNAIYARYDYHQNQDYIIDKKDVEQKSASAEENIIPLDTGVGVTQQNTIWTDLHPFIQIKHNLQITPDSLSSVFIANSEYIRLYKNISGLTGTLGSIEERGIIKALYNANSTIIPTYKASMMKYEDNLLVANDSWLKTISDDAIDHALNQSRATLIVCSTMQDVLDLEAQLTKENKNITIITYKDEHDAYKIEAINNGTGIEPRTIVIATNIGGRGTDIKLSNEVKENGGLHECTTFIASSRILKQALGRAGRQGEPGSAKIIIKQKHIDELGTNTNLANNFSNQDLYSIVDAINDTRMSNLESQIKKTESDAKYFTEFAGLYTNLHDIYTKDKSLGLNHFILEDLRLQWALAFDEKKDTKITEVFARFKTAIDNNDSYKHQFVNPYFAVKYVESILAEEAKDHNGALGNINYDKAQDVLNQNSILQDNELLYVSNMKLFEITISKAQKDEYRRLEGSAVGKLDFAEVKKHKEQARKYLESAQLALSKKIKYLEDIITSGNFDDIILPQNALNNSGVNCMLKHIESKYVILQLQLQHVHMLDELVKSSGNDIIYISAQYNLNRLMEKISGTDITGKIYREELSQIRNLGEDCFYDLKTLANVADNNPKTRAAMKEIAAGFNESILNLLSSTKGTLGDSGIFDIMGIIYSQAADTDSNPNTDQHLLNAISFDFAKAIESLKILHKISKYVAQNTNIIADNNKIATELTPKVTEQLELFAKKLSNITPKALVKSPKKYDANKAMDQTLKGNDTTKECEIDGWIDPYFGKYTLGAINNILKLRIKDAGVNNVQVANNNYFFVDHDDNNIQNLVDKLNGFKSPATILVPLNLYNNHAAGMICFIDRKENKNTIRIHYIDPENNQMPTELEQIFKYNGIETKQFTVATQEYANCGPEVIENFILYLAGERLSQEEAIPRHSLLVEQDLLQNRNNVLDIETQTAQKSLEEANNNHYAADSKNGNQITADQDSYAPSYKTSYMASSKGHNAQSIDEMKVAGIIEMMEANDLIPTNDINYVEYKISLIASDVFVVTDNVLDDIA